MRHLITQVKHPDARVERATSDNPRQSSGRDQRDKKPALRFKRTGDCVHCGEDHQRKNCRESADILRKGIVGKEEADRKLPRGYKGAFEKAKERQRRSQPEGRTNEFLGADSEDDSDSDTEIPIPMGKINAFTAVRNGNPLKYVSSHTD